jgi:hypothetical protein
MTGPALVEKARRLYNELSIKGTFNTSNGWLTCVNIIMASLFEGHSL